MADGEGPLRVGPAVPISAFSPLMFPFGRIGRDPVGVLGPLLVAGVVASADGIISSVIETDSVALVAAIFLGGLLLKAFCVAGMSHFFLKVARGKDYGWGDLGRGLRWTPAIVAIELLAYLGLALFATVVVVCFKGSSKVEDQSLGHLKTLFDALPTVPGAVGTALGVTVLVVGVVLVLVVVAGCALAVPLVVDRNMGPVNALLTSWELTRGNRGTIFWYWVLVGLVVGAAASAPFASNAAFLALSVPGYTFLYLALRGELVS